MKEMMNNMKISFSAEEIKIKKIFSMIYKNIKFGFFTTYTSFFHNKLYMYLSMHVLIF
jgi:hypothetical protein